MTIGLTKIHSLALMVCVCVHACESDWMRREGADCVQHSR